MNKWELSNEEKYAMDWFRENGYEILSQKQYVSKTIFVIKKNDFETKIELPQGMNYDIAHYMEMVNKELQMYCILCEIVDEKVF